MYDKNEGTKVIYFFHTCKIFFENNHSGSKKICVLFNFQLFNNFRFYQHTICNKIISFGNFNCVRYLRFNNAFYFNDF